MAKISQVLATGRRKEAVARIYLAPGEGKVTVNGRAFENYFPRESHRISILSPFKITNLDSKFDVMAKVEGGGSSGQAEAIRHGIARALVKTDDALRSALKKSGFLTRDPRMKERKKYGQKRARKRFQYSKR